MPETQTQTDNQNSNAAAAGTGGASGTTTAPAAAQAAPQSGPTAAATNENDAVLELAMKTDNEKLMRFGHVWSYPGAPIDNSGSNLRLPTEYVTDEQVQKALAAGELQALVIEPGGRVTVVQIASDEQPKVISTVQAGTAEVGTELPPGSTPSLDAAMQQPADDAPRGKGSRKGSR